MQDTCEHFVDFHELHRLVRLQARRLEEEGALESCGMGALARPVAPL